MEQEAFLWVQPSTSAPAWPREAATRASSWSPGTALPCLPLQKQPRQVCARVLCNQGGGTCKHVIPLWDVAQETGWCQGSNPGPRTSHCQITSRPTLLGGDSESVQGRGATPGDTPRWAGQFNAQRSYAGSPKAQHGWMLPGPRPGVLRALGSAGTHIRST